MEIVRDAFQTCGAEGIDAALSFFSPDFVWYPTDRWLEERRPVSDSGSWSRAWAVVVGG
jgi:hypothetical protein